jgi:hypothetical protein
MAADIARMEDVCRDGGAVRVMKTSEEVLSMLCSGWQIGSSSWCSSLVQSASYAEALRSFKELNISSTLAEDWNDDEDKWKGIKLEEGDLTEL